MQCERLRSCSVLENAVEVVGQWDKRFRYPFNEQEMFKMLATALARLLSYVEP